MSSNFNNAKIINVYYNKGDRKPYDVNGKPIAYIGEEFVGSNEGSELRFFFGQDLDSATPMIITKRPDGETYLDLCEKIGTGANSYYKVVLNNWYAEVKGKLTLIFKVYNGTVTLNEGNTEILSASGQVIVSDIFNLEVGYAPLATSAVPPYDPSPEASWYFALSQKLDKAQSITVTGALPTLTGDVYDDRYFYVENEGVGRLYYINGSTAIEVVFQVGTLKLTATGNGELTADTGKISWDEGYGGFEYIQYRDVANHIGQDIEYYGKAVGTIAKGDVIQFAGVQGNHFLIKKAVPSEINANPKYIMGISKQSLINNEFGYVAHFGRIRGINTSAYSEGALLWFSSSSINNGELTTTTPVAPNAKVLMAVVVDDANNGTILVRPTIEPSIKELQDVNITSIANNQVLRWNNANLRWENTSALTTAETDIDALEVRMTTEEGNVDNLQGRMTTAETDITNIENGTTIVPKANADKDNNEFDATYLKKASATATYIPLSQKGQANGVVPLGSNGKVPSIYLSGEQDDIQEFDTLEDFPLVGEADILYVAKDTNKLYRWGGSAYVVISETLAIGETASTAFAGNRGVALETLTTNIVNGTQALALKDQVIRNTATTTIPLVVNSIASTTANLTEFQVDGTKVLEVTPSGGLNQNGARLFSQPVDSTNTFFGQLSGNTSVTGTSNTGFGFETLENITSGSDNTSVGRRSSRSITTGLNNTSLGVNAGRAITTGSTNTFIGSNAGHTGAWGTQLVTATNSTALGFQAFTDKSNQMVFGNASVTEFKFDRNASATLLVPQITSSFSGGNSTFNRGTTALTNESASALEIKHTTSADMVDGFGARQLFTIRDSANVDNTIARLGSVRSGADNSGRFVFETNNAGSLTEKMTILPNGNVGIGTPIPFSRLHLVGPDANAARIRIENSAFGGALTHTDLFHADGGNFVILTKRTDDSATGQIHFATANNLTPKMLITRDGNVGIGTSSPVARLQVATPDATAYQRALKLGVGSSTNTSGTYIEFPSTTVDDFGSRIGGGREGIGGSSFIKFDTTNSSSVVTERMRILGNGNVGIGTTTPATQLHIFGADPIFTIQDSETTSSSTNVRLRLAESGVSNVVNEYVDLRKNGDDFQVDIFNGATTIVPLIVKYAGLVGINETAPSAQLQVKSGATTRVPLIVDTLASHTATLQEWKVNNVNVAVVSSTGSFRVGDVSGITSPNNSSIVLGSTGTAISRNVADTNPALIVNLASSTATGNIQVWQRANSAVIALDRFGTFRSPNGNIGIGLSNEFAFVGHNIADANPVLSLEHTNASATGYFLQGLNSAQDEKFYIEIDGDMYNSNGTYGTISDLRVKENIVQARNYTEDLMKLNVVKYSLKKDKSDKPTHLGFIAQEVAEIFPGLVETHKTKELEDMKTIKTSVLIPMLVKTIQELNKRIEELEKKIG